jgi:hypothetical protein
VSKWFQLLSATNLATHPDWTVEQQIQQPAGTDLPLTVSENGRSSVFFRGAQSDTLVSIASGGNVLRPNNCYSSQPGYFIIQRNYASSGSYPQLTVCYQVSGTATNGVDYTYLNGSGTILSGQDSVYIEVDPLSSFCGSNLTLTVTLMATNGYLVDTNGPSATMLIEANVFEVAACVSWNPVGLDYHPPTQSLLVSENASYDHNFVRVDGSGAVTPWADITGLVDQVIIGTVKTTANGFTAGDMYFDSSETGYPGLGWLSADGSRSLRDWAILPPPAASIGGIYVDRSGVFGGDLIATATDGRVWRVNAAGQAGQVAELGSSLGSVITLPNDVAQWGPWAGKILTGQDSWLSLENPEIYAIAPNGEVATNYLGMQIEALSLIPPNQAFYCVDPMDNLIWKVPAGVFAGHAGQLLITGTALLDGAQQPELFIAHWDAGTTSFVVEEISMPPLLSFQSLEQGAFAPIDIPCIPQ